ncbi:restriction endonuclease subunit S [Mesonia maritima]|uniref:Type I restriction enzyme S subunit n=1 Tax=Mesonia maritima TaxID=1793873 RepID=A0ABU1K5C3_9FLAO|nr:restriction endonuclease subunit S [Mesonia maritima]MDR6300818.1 type I restriction enzyme S subunit [Mesonia maritima]
MERYNDYKDSGIEWLGNIPKHWETFRFIDNVKLRHGYQFRDYDFTDEGIRVVKISQLDPKGNLNLTKSSFIASDRLNSFKAIRIYQDDILMALTGGTIGKIIRVGKISEPLLQNYRVGNFFPDKKKLNKTFLYFLLASQVTEEQINYLLNRNGQPNIGKESFKNMFFTLPPLKEQAQIANYLDAKTTSIDKKIKLLKQKIKHHKAYRKTLINETITKGLNGDVSSWVRFRLKDLGYLYSGLSGKSGDDFNQDDNPNNKGFIPFTNIAINTYLDKKQLGTVVIEDNEKQNQVKKNDIFFLMSSEGYEDIGKSAVLIEDLKETYLNSFCKGFRLTNKNSDASFINYLLLSDIYRQQMLVEGKGFTRINLKMEKVNNFSILIPPTKKEQQQIAAYLEAKTNTINNIVNNIETQITTLKELRKTLINEVVTGKVKVATYSQ